MFALFVDPYGAPMGPQWGPIWVCGLPISTQNSLRVKKVDPKPNPFAGWVGMGFGFCGFWRCLLRGVLSSFRTTPLSLVLQDQLLGPSASQVKISRMVFISRCPADFGVVVRSCPAPTAPGRTAQPRRIHFGLPNGD